VYRRALDGREPFERCTAGLPEWFPSNIDTHCLAASGSSAGFGTSEGEVFVSEDEGRTWERVVGDLPAVGCLLVAG
jgi:hypothetical protein